MKIPEWALHRAAQCWCEPETSGIEMDSRLATAFARALVQERESEDRLAELETLIAGHMQAMRPLLDEWRQIRALAAKEEGL